VQAPLIAQAVRELIPGDAHARVYTSDLRRAVQTAEPLAQVLGVRPEPDSRLREISYGAAEGKPQAWLDSRFVPAPGTAAGRLDHPRLQKFIDAFRDDPKVTPEFGSPCGGQAVNGGGTPEAS